MKTVNFSLEGKIALVTGASRGIGLAIAMTLSEYGADVIITSRKEENLKIAADKIKEELGKDVKYFSVNSGKLDEITNLFKEIENSYGRVDILVNNSATNPYFGTLIDAGESVWDKTNDVNLKGPFFMIQNAAKLMKKNGGGSIVNVASINGVSPAPLQGIYSITKGGLITLTKAYAKELAPLNIRVNALLPGLTKTKFASALFDNEEIYKYFIERVPLGRHAEPGEMAGAVLYLVSDASSYTTGACIACDGGYLI